MKKIYKLLCLAPVIFIIFIGGCPAKSDEKITTAEIAETVAEPWFEYDVTDDNESDESDISDIWK